MPFLAVLLVLCFIAGVTAIRIAKEYERGVLFRLGRFAGIRGPGLYFIFPFNIDRVVTVDLRIKTVSAEQQESITRDSVTIKVNAVLFELIAFGGGLGADGLAHGAIQGVSAGA